MQVWLYGSSEETFGMKNYLLIILLHLLLTPGLLAEGPVEVDKGVKKELAKLFDGEVAFNQISLSDREQVLPELAREGDLALSIVVEGDNSGYLFSTSAKGRYDYFDYTVIFAKDLSVLGVKVTTYRSSHGAEICSKGWLKQFKGYQGEEINIGKEVDGISRTTLSATSLVEDIQTVNKLMETLIP